MTAQDALASGIAEVEQIVARARTVHRTQSCGTPAVAVGAGNVTVIMGETADLADAAAIGGAFTNGMPFSLSMGCGNWGGNSVGTNLNWRHFVQTTKILREIPPREPALSGIFSAYWAEAGERCNRLRELFATG